MSLFRQLLPAVQESRCARCDTPIRERRRKPCPNCGAKSRVILRGFTNETVIQDRMNG